MLELYPPPLSPQLRLQLRPREYLLQYSSFRFTFANYPHQYFGPDANETVTEVSNDYCPECAPHFGPKRIRRRQ